MGPPDPRAHQNNRAECDILVSKILGFKTFPIVLKGSVSVLKKFRIEKVLVLVSTVFGIEKSIGMGFGKFWFQKKYRYRFQKKLVSKKVLVSVSKKIGIKKSIGIGFAKFQYRKKYRFRKFLLS